MHGMTPGQKGRNSERNVREVLIELENEGLIRGFRNTKKNSNADRRGVDFYIFTATERIPLQVKSSFHAMNSRAHYAINHSIPCVVGYGPGLKAAIKRIIRQYMERCADGNTTG